MEDRSTKESSSPPCSAALVGGVVGGGEVFVVVEGVLGVVASLTRGMVTKEGSLLEVRISFHDDYHSVEWALSRGHWASFERSMVCKGHNEILVLSQFVP